MHCPNDGWQPKQKPSKRFLVAFKPVFARFEILHLVSLAMGGFSIFAILLKPLSEYMRLPDGLRHGFIYQHSVCHDGLHVSISIVWSLHVHIAFAQFAGRFLRHPWASSRPARCKHWKVGPHRAMGSHCHHLPGPPVAATRHPPVAATGAHD